jgi:hypothetical protein
MTQWFRVFSGSERADGEISRDAEVSQNVSG